MNVEVNVDTPVENYWCETTQGREVLQIESDISIAQNDDDEGCDRNWSHFEKAEEPKIESKEDQPLIFYTADTFVLDDHDMTDSFVLEVPNELPILKEGVHAALPKYVDAPFIVDISKGEGIT
ncbi:hypothetical protein Scep_019676 [Stephania cephalantha]|uniref:Uncharacterized protein n=1 Tax=Stephania cephalantha TaxID=152367 RepID=A0AAP0IBR4_9MAGN